MKGLRRRTPGRRATSTRAAPSWLHERVTERLVTTRYDTSPLGTWAREQARLNDLRTMIEAEAIKTDAKRYAKVQAMAKKRMMETAKVAGGDQS